MRAVRSCLPPYTLKSEVFTGQKEVRASLPPQTLWALLLLTDDLPGVGVPGPEKQWLLWMLWQWGLREAICGELSWGQSPESLWGSLLACAGLHGWDKQVTSPNQDSWDIGYRIKLWFSLVQNNKSKYIKFHNLPTQRYRDIAFYKYPAMLELWNSSDSHIKKGRGGATGFPLPLRSHENLNKSYLSSDPELPHH